DRQRSTSRARSGTMLGENPASTETTVQGRSAARSAGAAVTVRPSQAFSPITTGNIASSTRLRSGGGCASRYSRTSVLSLSSSEPTSSRIAGLEAELGGHTQQPLLLRRLRCPVSLHGGEADRFRQQRGGAGGLDRIVPLVRRSGGEQGEDDHDRSPASHPSTAAAPSSGNA